MCLLRGGKKLPEQVTVTQKNVLQGHTAVTLAPLLKAEVGTSNKKELECRKGGETI